MSPDQWDDVVEDAPGEDVGEGDVRAEYRNLHDVTEAVWALWGQVDVLRQELENERQRRERDGEAASAVMSEAIEALRGDLARRQLSPPEAGASGSGAASSNANTLRTLSSDVERIQAALLADRAERQRFESALPALVRKELERALVQEATARAHGDDATQQALKGAFDMLRAELRGAIREKSSGDGPSVPKVVRAALDELKFQLVEERSQREERDAAVAPALRAVDEDLTALHAVIEAERRERLAGQQQMVAAAEALRTDLEKVRLATQRAEEAAEVRHVAAESNQATAAAQLHEVVREELADVGQALMAADEAHRLALAEAGRAMTASDEAHRVALAEVAATIDELRRTAVAAAQSAEAEDARYAEVEAQQAAAVEVALNAVRGELAALREQRGEGERSAREAMAALREQVAELGAKHTEQAKRDEALFAAVGGLRDEVRQAREELFNDRQLREELDAADVAANETMHARLAELRELFLQEAVRQGSREEAFAQLRDDVVQDMVQREAAAAELRAILVGQREAEERQVNQRQSWEAALGGALATLHDQLALVQDELLAGREELASLKALFAENRREQEALAFKLPEATEEMQQQVAKVQGANVETLKQLEELLRSTMSGANTWFVRTRDDLVARMDQVASTLDLGIAESMVAVLEQLRAEVAQVRDELAALGRRQHLTAAQVRKIVKEGAPDGADGNGKGKVAKPARATRARTS